MNAGRAFVGIVLVAIGVAYVMDANGALDAGEAIGRWWPAAIVGLGVLHAIDRGRFTTGSSALVVIGGFLLLISSGLLGSDAWSYAWPIALILLGTWLAFGWGRRSARRYPEADDIDGLGLLSAVRVGSRSQSFRHASLTAVLGGVTLDLTEATPIDTGAVADVTSLLGGVTILVPQGWSVDVRGVPVLGGWDDTTDRSSAGSTAPRLEVRALVVLGGLEVKHAGRWSV